MRTTLDGAVERTADELKEHVVDCMVKAFNDGYRLGVEYGRSLYKSSKKIEVEQSNPTQSIEFTRLDDGTLHNYGRSLPF